MPVFISQNEINKKRAWKAEQDKMGRRMHLDEKKGKEIDRGEKHSTKCHKNPTIIGNPS